MKPISMSSASAIAALTPASIVDWSIAPASWKSRKPCTSGKLRQVDGAPGAAGVHGEEQRREDDDRRQELRPAERLHAPSAGRAPRRRGSRRRSALASGGATAAALTPDRLPGSGLLLLGALEVAAGLLDEHVVERGLHQLERLDRTTGLVQRAHDRRHVRARRARRPTIRVPSRPASARRSARVSPRRAPIRPPAITSSRCGRRPAPSAPPACPRRPSCPSSMIPTRSASWSASSRYCVVRKTVVPSSFSRRTSSQIAMPADGVEAGGRLVEEQDPRVVDERRREVEPPAHAAGVGADAAVGGLPSGPTRSSSASPRLRRLVARTARAASPGAASARARSSAGRAPPPGARRRSSAARWAASRHHVVAGHQRGAAGRPQQRDSIRTVVVLPAPFGPRKA